jgi:hypothetical protein
MTMIVNSRTFKPLGNKFGKEEKLAWAIAKKEQEEAKLTKNEQEVKCLAKKYQETVRRQRLEAGLT